MLPLRHDPKPARLDLGSGPRPREGYTGVDRQWARNVVPWDFRSTEDWPFESESVEALYSSHLIEHLPPVNVLGGDVLVRFFEEAWRVARVGAVFELRWPVPFHPETGLPVASAWWDPTHYRHIPDQQIYSYFSVEGRRAMGVESYGIRCNWYMRQVGYRVLNDHPLVLEYVAELVRELL